MTIPPRAASSGSVTRRCCRSSPRSNSRRASSPTVKKNNAISPLLTQPRRSRDSPRAPSVAAPRMTVVAGDAGTVRGMGTAQGGIFALGTASHAYLEFDLRDERDGAGLVRAVSALREPRTTMGGVNLVAGFRPELWRSVAPDGCLVDLAGFNRAVVGVDGFVAPAT